MSAILTGAYGRLKALSTNLLSNDYITSLLNLGGVNEVAEALARTWYGEDIEALATLYRPPELIEVALNRHLARLNALSVSLAPYHSRGPVRAYLAKWDLYNIELLLAAKAQGRTVGETESFFVSSRNLPVSETGANIPFGELRALLQQPDIESIANYLVKYGYGATLLQELPRYRESQDLGIFSTALSKSYFARLMWELRFLRGDEGPLREYFRAQISKQNLLKTLKALGAHVPRDVLGEHLVEEGFLGAQKILEIYSAGSLDEMLQFFSAWLGSQDIFEDYRKDRNLSNLEVKLDQHVESSYVEALRGNSLSLSTVILFLIFAELERRNIRTVVYGKKNRLAAEDIRRFLVMV